MLADALDAVDGTGLGGYDRYFDPAGQQPLSTAIDRWGHTPLAATALTSRAVAGIVRMHLTDGHPPAAHCAVTTAGADRGIGSSTAGRARPRLLRTWNACA